MDKKKMFPLRVKNLPNALTNEAIEALLLHYEATSVCPLGCSQSNDTSTSFKRKKRTAIACFDSEQNRLKAKEKLNQLELGGYKIEAIEIQATTTAKEDDLEDKDPPLPLVSPPPVTASSVYAPTHPPPAPLAPHLGLNYAPSPLLEYKYPKATDETVANIANALMVLPNFYTQVLHLMNKMHLPPPFEPHVIPGVFSSSKKRKRSSSVSEKATTAVVASIEEDEEEEEEGDTTTVIVDAMLRPAVAAAVIESKPKSKKLQKQKMPRLEATQGSIFDDENDMTSSSLAYRPGVISDTELRRRRLSMVELSKDKAMTNYRRGEVSNALYIKNLSKQNEQKDLEFLFGCVIPPELPLSCLQIQYFKQGKLKGQAFIEFPTVEMATKAIDKLHGIKWYEDKPLIISFRKPKPIQ